jgi:hypothetical protein
VPNHATQEYGAVTTVNLTGNNYVEASKASKRVYNEQQGEPHEFYKA